MNIIQKSISDARFRIPRQLLERGLYTGRGPKLTTVTGIEERIMSLVVRPRVLVDLNLLSSNVNYIPLSDAWKSEEDEYGVVVTIPNANMGGKSIIETLSLCNENISQFDTDTITYSTIHTNLELIAENTIYLHGYNDMISGMVLKANVGYSSNLTELPPRAGKEISRFITLAIESYIYNELTIDLAQGELYFGTSLDAMRSALEKYSESEEKYETMKDEVIDKVLFMSNNQQMSPYMANLFFKNPN